ncbi:MAG: hypothetical protein MK175_20120 [Pseudoalteromonas sp.]|uniref:hypothetical protein n=1 Tax=Pseudoalteromonas sp. TaxID=53249 RepID=UPI00260092AD|nr:hypothetical protein [Pseudoalteromonas sp.]MCH2089495.1 hypothetical protein [Pseudoalteromonas sp.]
MLTEDQLIKKALNKETREKKKIKNKMFQEDERLATRSIELEKGQWFFKAAGMKLDNGKQFPKMTGIIPYEFFKACQYYAKFRHSYYAAAKSIGCEIDFGLIVGGVPVKKNEQGEYVADKKKPTRKFYLRRHLKSDYCDRLIIHSKENDEFSTIFNNNMKIENGVKLRLKGNKIQDEDAEREVTFISRAVGYVINKGDVNHKMQCFGLIPYRLIEQRSERDQQQFDHYYHRAFAGLGNLGEVQYGWIVKVKDYSKKGFLIECFLTIKEENEDFIVRLYDFKSKVGNKLVYELDAMGKDNKNKRHRNKIAVVED